MPGRKEPMLTVKFMQGVMTKRNWILRSHEVTAVRACADPPTRKVLAKIVATTLKPTIR